MHQRQPELRISNAGEMWPKPAVFQLYKIDGRELLTTRSLRLSNGQGVSFRIDRDKVEGSAVGLWVNTTWYDRPFKYDAAIKCD